MVREKDKKRVLFDYTKKQKILNKSHGVCASCGRPLDVTTMTVDHFIPLSKGGTNETANLVALCEDCNKKKRNFVVEPEGWYPYLDGVFLRKLSNIYDNYCLDRAWFNSRNLLRVDSSGRVNFRSYGGIFFRKADYSDLDDIYKCYSKCYNSLSLPYSRRDINSKVKNFISFVFDRGCLYFLRDDSGRVLSVVPMVLVKNSRRFQMLVPNILVTCRGNDIVGFMCYFLLDCVVNKFWWGINNVAMDLIITYVRGSYASKNTNSGTSYLISKALDYFKIGEEGIIHSGTEGDMCRWDTLRFEGKYTDAWSICMAVCKDYNVLNIDNASEEKLTSEIEEGLEKVQTNPFMNVLESEEDFERIKSNIALFEAIS